MKSVNLAKVSFSPKWLMYFILAVILVLIGWGIANFLYGKVTGLAGGVTGAATNGGF